MTVRAWTGVVLVATGALLLAWEFYALSKHEDGDTISEVVQFYAYRYPILILLSGILIGHFFWPVQRPPVFPVDKDARP